ncbi:MAG: N-acetylneuraminate synthase [Candidatus Lokiarchaeota archaeon]|nr:N-acetylneuraminate synthase [Candidatus Lokiarchaeota archaeon]
MNDLREKLIKSDLFVIAEIGMNHDGSFGNAIRLIEEAKSANVNAVKFQLHISDEESLKKAPKPPYFRIEERFEYFERTAFSIQEWKKLKSYANNLGLFFLISPFSKKAVDITEKIGINGYKIASGETTNLPLLEYINEKNKPILLSTGMSNWEEIENAVNVLRENLVCVFQCTSLYPCPAEEVGLNIIKEIDKRFNNFKVGYSDHTIDIHSAIAAYIFGARVFEKHFTLSKKMYGADARFSMEPEGLRNYVSALQFVSKTIKNPVNKDNLNKFNEMKKIFEKSIVASKNLVSGRILSIKDIRFKKPGDGIRADQYRKVIGMRLIKDLKRNQKISHENLEKP